MKFLLIFAIASIIFAAEPVKPAKTVTPVVKKDVVAVESYNAVFTNIEMNYKKKNEEISKQKVANIKATQQLASTDSLLKLKADSSFDATELALRAAYDVELKKISAQEEALKVKKSNLEAAFKAALQNIGVK